MPRPPLVISHRTQAGTMPEKTLAGVDPALESGVDAIELDVRATSDGVVVLMHDETLERVAGRSIVAVEVKQSGSHELVAAEVRRAEAAEWTWIWAFDPAMGRECRRLLPEVPASLLVGAGSLERCGFPDTPIEIAVREGFAGVSWHHSLVDASTGDVVDAARRRDLTHVRSRYLHDTVASVPTRHFPDAASVGGRHWPR